MTQTTHHFPVHLGTDKILLFFPDPADGKSSLLQHLLDNLLSLFKRSLPRCDSYPAPPTDELRTARLDKCNRFTFSRFESDGSSGRNVEAEFVVESQETVEGQGAVCLQEWEMGSDLAQE